MITDHELREIALRHALDFHHNDMTASGEQILETAERFLNFLKTGKAKMASKGDTPTT